uniref:NADH-ubiquinone oxidoreductase chain 2 n=1 Tax=Palaemon capensis TaxID=1440474 RepID=A0A385JG36_9EUCA|nr:NADH dehydrogenase subunit 2 [Palaemon capensis]AXY96103.1 NADH dehydrogenase subunit 2 [Palaemon capensis]
MLFVNPSSIMFMFTLILGTFISISSSSWFISWVGLELNLISFIPLMFSKENMFSSEATFKYFLIQALGSAILLMSVSLLLIFGQAPKILILTSLLLKMGAAPFHFWLPSIMQGISWPSCIILMTVQKIGPLGLTSYIISSDTLELVMSSSILSAILGGIGGLNQTLLRKIMAFSSVAHMGWLLASLTTNSLLWVHYLAIYSIMSSSLAIFFNYNQAFHVKQLIYMSSSSGNKLMMFMCLLSLGGLPPLLGFIPKLSVIKELTYQNNIMWVFILTMSALITLFFYTRIVLSALSLTSPKMKSTSLNFNYKLSALAMLNFLPLLFPMMTLMPS